MTADRAAERLDNFTDAAFAFAVTLLVAGGDFVRPSAAELWPRVANLPAAAIGFGIIGMFWHAHVRWRRARGVGGVRSTLLTFALVFSVLVFVFPLAAMAESFAAFLLGRSTGDAAIVAQLFTVYGATFVVMAALMSALFADALANSELAPADRQVARGDVRIWFIIALTGAASTLLAALGGRGAVFAPMVYALLPVFIGVFAWRWRWTAG